MNTLLMTNYTQNGPQKSWQVKTPSRVGKSRCYSCFLMFLCCIGEWLHDARCFHLECCHQIGKLLMCAQEMLHPFQLGSRLTMTNRLQSTWWCEVKRQNQYFEVVGSSSSVPLGRNAFNACLNHSCTLTQCSKGPCGLETLDMHRWVFGAPNDRWKQKCQMQPRSDISTNRLDSATPKSVKWPLAKKKDLLQAPIVPKCKPVKSQIKGQCHRSSLKRRE